MRQSDKPDFLRELIIGGGVFVIPLGVYLLTICPTIYWEDCAAFCAVHSLLGIPHSPGFPIFVILGRLLSMFSPSYPAFCSNLMSALWGSLALFLLYLLINQVFKQAKISHPLSSYCSITATLLLAFSSSFWLQNVRAEVYTLNILFILLLSFLVIRWGELKQTARGYKILLLSSFIFGLSLTNHPLLLITLMPAFLFFIFSADLKLILNPKKLIVMVIFALLGMSLYLYVPVRSGLLPAINWGSPDNLSNFVSYLFRTSQPPASVSGPGFSYLSRFWFNLSFPVDQFGLPFFWLGVVGAISLFKLCRRISLFLLLIFSLNILTATWAADFSERNYDLLGYLLPSLSAFTIWFAVGLKTTLSWMSKEVRTNHANHVKESHKLAGYVALYAFLATFLLLPAIQVWRNFNRCDKSNQVWAYQYADRLLGSVKQDALILVDDDNTLTSLWYVNLACGMRPDVKIMSVSGLLQPGYRRQIRQQYPEIPLPQIVSGNPGETAYRISRLNAGNFPVYVTPLSKHAHLVPHLHPAGFLLEFDPKEVVLTDKDKKRQRDFLKRELDHKTFDTIAREHFGNLLFNMGVFYDQLGASSSSLEYFMWSLDKDPSNARIYFQLGKAFLKNGDKDKARDFFQAGLELDPYNQEAKKLLERIRA
jgi:tetratricopeptide (TPR) repeat protein